MTNCSSPSRSCLPLAAVAYWLGTLFYAQFFSTATTTTTSSSSSSSSSQGPQQTPTTQHAYLSLPAFKKAAYVPVHAGLSFLKTATPRFMREANAIL